MKDGSKEARNHVNIALRVKRIAKVCLPGHCVFLAPHNQRAYQDLERQSGEEFWSVKAYSSSAPASGSRVKDPDAIITQGDRVCFLVEIKWGAVPGAAHTDVPLTQAEWKDLASRLRAITVCRVRGPAVKAGVRNQSHMFTDSCDYQVDCNAQLLLVANFHLMRSVLPEQCEEARRAWALARCDPHLADISERVGEIPSLPEVLTDKVLRPCLTGAVRPRQC